MLFTSVPQEINKYIQFCNKAKERKCNAVKNLGFTQK